MHLCDAEFWRQTDLSADWLSRAQPHQSWTHLPADHSATKTNFPIERKTSESAREKRKYLIKISKSIRWSNRNSISALAWWMPHINAVAVTTWIGVKSPPRSSVAIVVAAVAFADEFGMDIPLPCAYVCTTFSVIRLITDSVPTDMWRDVPNKK